MVLPSTAIAYAGAEATARADADRQARLALCRQLAVKSARELDGTQYEVALSLAIESGRVVDTAEAFAALCKAIAHPGRTRLILSGHEGVVVQAAWNAHKSRILTASGDSTTWLWYTHGEVYRATCEDLPLEE
jgi:hypothetical protein